MDDLDQRIDALYAGSPSDFTAGRDALAKDLRAAGERDEADRVRRLRRPTKIAAELNRLAREEPGGMAAAIDAEGALEAAQRGVLEGTGSADELRDAERREADAVAALSADPAIRAALRLAARSADARDDLRRGRISQDPEADPAAGLFGMGPVRFRPGPRSPLPRRPRRPRLGRPRETSWPPPGPGVSARRPRQAGRDGGPRRGAGGARRPGGAQPRAPARDPGRRRGAARGRGGRPAGA